MKNYWKTALWSMALILFTFMATSCGDDDEDEAPELRTKVYTLQTVTAGVGGTVTFNEVNSTSTSVTVVLTGAPDGGVHPAHIHDGDIDNPGGIAYNLGPIENSTNTVTLDASYDALTSYNGYVNIHLSAEELEVIVANANIGSNE
ncbi:CHRD domain-containing protein [Bernardetia sp. ABR2-2B]|uniref:CHRD domain-containing protein n=1 Tax=Bernardetia sp. ABR2-2B TaxID=3127472 RepID=UPI0030CBDFB1